MSAPHLPKVAGIDPEVSVSTHTAAPLREVPAAPGAFIQDRLAGWVSDLTTLHELTERLASTATLDAALNELLHAGAALVGARRGLLVLEPADSTATPSTTLGLGLSHADLGHIETVERGTTALGRVLDGHPGTADGLATPDLLGDPDLDPATARSPPASATPPVTPCPSPPRRPDGSARPSGSTTNPGSPRRSSATSSASTRGTPPSTWPA